MHGVGGTGVRVQVSVRDHGNGRWKQVAKMEDGVYNLVQVRDSRELSGMSEHWIEQLKKEKLFFTIRI